MASSQSSDVDLLLLPLSRPCKTPFVPGSDGPVNRLKAIKLQQPIFSQIINELVAGVSNTAEWGHNLRIVWRNELIHKAARDRPQHFSDLAAGCDFQKTLSLYKRWGKALKANFTEHVAIKLGILRRLLCGGLLTEEMNARHRKHQDTPKCACGAVPTVLHISWCCPLHADVRDPCFTFLGHNGDCFPTCTRYAAIVPASSFITLLQIEKVQETPVTIWLHNIEAYHQKRADEDQHPLEMITTTSGGNTEYTSNGHQMAPRVGNPGVWRAQPMLLQEEWVTTVKHHQHLDASGGIAICRAQKRPCPV